VFSKTGAGRQADLVKLAAGFSNPLANRSAAADKAPRLLRTALADGLALKQSFELREFQRKKSPARDRA
jgi:hypothetical protein